jgi:hypothetical protein
MFNNEMRRTHANHVRSVVRAHIVKSSRRRQEVANALRVLRQQLRVRRIQLRTRLREISQQAAGRRTGVATDKTRGPADLEQERK